MNWVRSKARKLSLLALFALAVQLGMSFGHVHASTFGPVSAKATLSHPSSPGTDGDRDNGNDGCAVCATIAMANALVDSAPPALPLPVLVRPSSFLIAAALDSPQPQRLSFQSRAPPRS
jgi:hypothetical protein